MKKNNKGFMLAEVVITSTVVMTAMISLYFTFNKIYARYNTLTTYKNVDGMYAIENIIDNMISDENTNTNINKIISSSNNVKIIDNSQCKISPDYCAINQQAYNIQNMYIIKKDNTIINNLKNTVTNNTFKDYLTYISKYYNFESNLNNHLVIIEYKDGEEYNYSSIELG